MIVLIKNILRCKLRAESYIRNERSSKFARNKDEGARLVDVCR